MYMIYYIFCPNNKGYVGFTSKSLETRLRNHFAQARKGSPYLLHKAIRKYGPSKFTIMLLYRGTSYENILNIREEYYIRKLGTHFSTGEGYNMTYGGQGGIGRKKTPKQKAKEQTYWTDENRAAHAAKLSGSNNPMYGRKHPNHRVRKGVEHPNFGKHHSEITKEKNRQQHLGRRHSKETRLKMSASRKGRKLTPEQIEKTASWHRGKKRSPEACKRIREGIIKAFKAKPPQINTRDVKTGRFVSKLSSVSDIKKG